ncbi:MAG: hypothetical protein V1720_04500 [bacterium]
MKHYNLFFVLLLSYCYIFPQGKSGSYPKININDDHDYISGNEILMWVGNNGMCAHDPRNDASGFYWPGGENATITAIFTDGLIWGGKINDEIRVGGATYRYGLQAGKILPNGDADNPELEKYRIYKIRKGIINKDYNEWPVEDGAPWIDIDGDGMFSRSIDKPQFLGDETIWYVMNDLDSNRTQNLYGSSPIGFEMQVTIWASMDMPDVVFKKYVIINKSNSTIKDMYFAQWSDPDLGFANDDFVGCDTTLSLAFCYNGDNDDDNYYKLNPPAVGYTMLQGPIILGEPTDSALVNGEKIPGYKNLPLSSFVFYLGAAGYTLNDPFLGVYQGSIQVYNYMQGKLSDGEPFLDPNTGIVTKFWLSGDPVNGTGWYEGIGWSGGPPADDRRILASYGPVVMAPADTQEVVIAVHITRGENNIQSVKKLKDHSAILHRVHNNPGWFQPPPEPIVNSRAENSQITLWWEANAEDYELVDYNILFSEHQDTTFNFEGYRIWQFSDAIGTNPLEIAVYDLNNSVNVFYGYQTIEGIPTRVPLLRTPDYGLRRWIKIEKDYYSNSKLLNGKKYYFGITAFAYSPFSRNQLIESPLQIVEIIPGRNSIDYTIDFNPDEFITAEHSSGDSDGLTIAKIIDETILTGDEYEIKFSGDLKSAFYSIKNKTKNLSIIDSSDYFYIDTLGSVIYDGLMFFAINFGRDTIYSRGNSKNSAIKEIVETSNGDGHLDIPINVFNQFNSKGKWLVSSNNANEEIENINVRDNIGYSNYEIRFTQAGSEYYPSVGNYGQDIIDCIKSTQEIPVEIWNVTKNERLTIRIHDWNKNGIWDTDGNSNWESIIAVNDPQYVEPLPERSGRISAEHVFINNFVINGELPETGTVIQINTWKPLREGDIFTITSPKPNFNNLEAAKERINEITVFPNPFYDNTRLYHTDRKVTFTNLPNKVLIRIYTIAGTFVTRLEKDSESPWLDWDLTNSHGGVVGGGIYLAYIEMPGIGNKILKIAVVL